LNEIGCTGQPLEYLATRDDRVEVAAPCGGVAFSRTTPTLRLIRAAPRYHFLLLRWTHHRKSAWQCSTTTCGTAVASLMEAQVEERVELLERCCGLDVHKEEVTACILVKEHGKIRKELRRFQTFTATLLQLAEWLMQNGISHVAMESTGVYWKPVYAVLESVNAFDLTVGNAQHMKNVPMKKTDMKDAEWIATLLRMGLIQKSYVPTLDLRDLRDLTRYRRSVIKAQTAEKNRLQKLLETANIKLGSVASDVFGKSGTKMLRAMGSGEANKERLADMAEGLLRKKLESLRLALEGNVRDHHRFLLKMQLDRLDQLEKDIATLDAEIQKRLEPYRKEATLLATIPGVKEAGAANLIAEIGTDMRNFRSAAALCAWAGICPGNNESAGKARGVKARKGNVHLRTALVEAAQAARRTKGTYLKDKYHRIMARRGANRAVVAIGHKILVAVYEMLSTGKPYKDLSETYLDRLDEKRVTSNLTRRLERLGYEVTLSKRAA
jgi:transposase